MDYALMGLSGCGKSTAAQAMVSGDSYRRRIAFADPFKSALAEMGLKLTALYGDDARKNELVQPWGRTTREMMISLGTWGREIKPSIWSDLLVGEVERGRDRDPRLRFVVDDLRFVNEADALRKLGFQIVRIDGPVMEGNRYEMDQIVPDIVFKNDGAVVDLIDMALSLVKGRS